MGRGGQDELPGEGALRAGQLTELEHQTQRAYDVAARQWAAARSTADFWAAEHARFAELLAAPARVLDLGCGTGRDIGALTRSGYEVVGADLSAGMLEQARREHPEAELIEASLYELPLKNESLDGVCSAATLLHVPHERLPQALGEIHRVLRPGGVVFCSVKAGEGERLVEGDVGPRFFAFHDAEGFARAFSEAGFDVARVERLERAGAEWITLFARRGR